MGGRARRAFDSAVIDLERVALPEAVASRTRVPRAGARASLALRMFQRALVGVGDAREPARSCLPRALALYGEARRAGLDVRLVVGVRREGDGGGVASHAWVELDGRPFLEPMETSSRFSTITRLPTEPGVPR